MRKAIGQPCHKCSVDDWYIWSSGYKTCAPCKQAKSKEWVANNRDKVLAYSIKNQAKTPDMPRVRKNQHLKRKYGITIEQYEEMFLNQDESCAICKEKSSATSWHLDHNHITNKVRAILCHHCNVLLGFAKDNTTLLEKVIDYLEFHK